MEKGNASNVSGKRGLRLRAAAIAIAVAVSTASCGGAPAAAPGGPDIHGNIHRVESGGNVAYVFGSMHLGRPEWFPLGDAVEGAMRRADVFAFEFDFARTMELAILSERYATLPDGHTLATFLPRDAYETFVANLSTFDFFVYEQMNAFSPFFLSTLAAMEILVEELGLRPEYSVDFYVLRFAVEAGKPFVGLNDVRSEVSILFDLSHEALIAAAETTMDRETTLATARDLRMVELYETQDLAGFLDLRLSMADADDAFSRHALEAMVHARCRIFAAEIGRLLTETEEPTTFFVTVGMLHIIGGDVDLNVLGLLRDAGFKVEPVF